MKSVMAPNPRSRKSSLKSLLSGVSVISLISMGLLYSPAVAAAEEPVQLPETVSADYIPTPQLNGVAWDLRVRGDVAYVVGSFTRARPSGVAAGGAGEVVRNNGMAFNIVSGKILPWNPNFNAPVLDIEFSPEGNTFYAGGQFTAVSGQARSKVAEFNTSTGNLSGFSTSVGGHVETLAVTSDSLYIGGSFNTVGNQTRRSLAKFNRTNGSLQPWSPVVDDMIHGLIATDQSNRVLIGGRFQSINGEPKVGIGAVDKDSGQQLRWDSTPIPARIATEQRSWNVDLKLVDGVVFAANNGQGGHWFDGRWAADFETGSLNWLDNCYGSTSSITVMSDVVYSTPHAHDCSSVNGFPEESPTIWKRALAETSFATGIDKTPPGSNSLIRNQPIPTLLHWYPLLNTGTYTGQYQGGWAMDNNGDYLVMGGEFTRLNNNNQQGLAVFPKRSISPNKQRPEYTTNLKPTAISQGIGSIRIAWPTTWDFDDETLTYEVLRDNSLTAIDSQEAASIWWKQQSLGFRDNTAVPGSTHTYRIRVSDPWGNNYIGPRSDPVTVSNAPLSPYTQALTDAGADIYYPLNEADGTVAFDNIGFNDADASAALLRSQTGAIENDKASGFSGQSIATRSTVEGPNTFSLQAWFKTGTTTGGKLIGFGNARTGNSNSYDRHIWMDNSGKIHFGTWVNSAATVASASSYNDNEWHQVVASLGTNGMNLYIDGLKVAERTDVTNGQAYSGVWRIGGDNMNGWPNQPSSTDFNGTLDEVAIFNEVIGSQKVLELYQASGRTADIPEPPTDAYGMSVYQDEPHSFWRLDEETGNLAKDQTIFKNDGNVLGNVTMGQSSAFDQGHSFGFGNPEAVVVGKNPQSSPTVFSTEAWFKTSSSNGGKIIGFGNAASGLSSSYDRHVYMRDDGTLLFGTYTGGENIAVTEASYNDGQWHHVVATLSNEGMKLYVDGGLQATNPQTGAEPYSGYWRVGGDRVWGGASSAWFDGEIDEVAIYPRALSLAEVNEHYSIIGSTNVDPQASFTSSSNGLEATFDASASQDTDGNILKYSWAFGDGSSEESSTVGITHTYAQPGTYTVKLTVSDDRGGNASTTNTITVQAVNQPPTATMVTSQNGLRLTVDGATSTDPDGQIASYLWDFGDGSATATGANSEHVYADNGTYTVRLTVRDNDGAIAETQSEVIVSNAAPQAAFQLNVDALTVSVDGNGSSDPEGGALEYAWSFGDGQNATGATTTHEYAEPGEYTIVLTVTDEHGATHSAENVVSVSRSNTAPIAAFTSTADELTVSFDASTSSDADGEIASYTWDFGDNAQATGKTTNHTYSASGSYEVTLLVTDNNGATHLATAEIKVVKSSELNPTAAFTSTIQGLTATLDGTTSMPPAAGGEIDSYIWNFGDGQTSQGAETSHEFASAGTYSVSLTVTSGNKEGSVTQVISVTELTGPIPQFVTQQNGRLLGVDASLSEPAESPITKYEWDFGDGTMSTGAIAEHRFENDGEFIVSLKVTDSNGMSASTNNTISVVNDLPVPAFSVSVDGLKIDVDASTSTDANGAITKYAWSFGDGTNATGTLATHTYTAAGDFQVRLTVTDEDGATAFLEQAVQVAQLPAAQVLAKDEFNRTATNEWGTANIGGKWVPGGAAANFGVSNGQGHIRMATSGSGPRMSLPVSLREADMTVKLSLDKAATGGGLYQYVTVREIPNVGSYRLKIRHLSNGTVAATLERIVGGTISSLTPETTIGQLQGGAENPIKVRLLLTGTSQSILSAKVYAASSIEPAAWQLTATDSTASLQAAGRVGLAVYLSGSATNSPVISGFDDLTVNEVE